MMKKIHKRKDNDYFVVILRHISNFTAKILSKTPITPNQVTILGFIFLTPPILYFIIQGTHLGNLIALGLIFIAVVLDLSDGTLARIKGISSPYGAWLDRSLDMIFQISLFVAIIIGVYQNTQNTYLVFTGLTLLFGQTIANYIGSCYEKDFGFDAYNGSEIFNQKFVESRKLPIIDLFFKNIIVPSNMFYIFVFTSRYLLLLGLIFDRLDIFLIVFAITINIRWITMYFLYLIYLTNNKTRLNTIKVLRKIGKQ